MRAITVVAAMALSAPTLAGAQQRWQRGGGPTAEPITVFHSPQSANLPTAETIHRGEWQFEVSHRFQPAFSQGSSALWGLDGPAWIRLGLTYGATDRVNVGILRTNLNDNLEFNAKVRFAEGGSGKVPWMAALMGGVAINPGLVDSEGIEGNEPQAYGQLLLNALFGSKWAVGVVPSLLYNPYIADVDKGTALSVGLNSQLYVARGLSLMGEWNISQSHVDLEHKAGAFGIELETGGHFFKLMATNSTRPDPTQFLAGTPLAWAAHEWRFGFNITRLLAY
jgi:Membrane bound beta barrel domain (DUF5777)